MRVVAVSAGLSAPSTTRMLADRLLSAVAEATERRGQIVSTEVIEVRELAHDVVDLLLTRVSSDALTHARNLVQEADALVVVSPTFTMSYSGLLKSFLDVLDTDALVGTPVLLAATGGSTRHTMMIDTALRPVLTYLKALTLPVSVFASAEDWADDTLDRRIVGAADSLAALLVALPSERRADPFDPHSGAFVSFDQMLAP